MSNVRFGKHTPGWETVGKTMLLLEEVLVRPAGGAHPMVYVGPNAYIFLLLKKIEEYEWKSNAFKQCFEFFL